LEVAFSTRTASAFSELIILCQIANITFNAKITNQSKANAAKENPPDKRTIIPEQKAFQGGTGAPVEQPSPDNPDHSIFFFRRKKKEH
jgi:hypothetical protein